VTTPNLFDRKGSFLGTPAGDVEAHDFMLARNFFRQAVRTGKADVLRLAS
jgi:hypothetical protein